MMTLLYGKNQVDKQIKESKKDIVIATQKISKSARVTIYQSGKNIIKLYDTDILIIDNEKITLNSGGFRTHTTKARINQFLPADISLFQKGYNWYIKQGQEVKEFFDGIVLSI